MVAEKAKGAFWPLGYDIPGYSPAGFCSIFTRAGLRLVMLVLFLCAQRQFTLLSSQKI